MSNTSLDLVTRATTCEFWENTIQSTSEGNVYAFVQFNNLNSSLRQMLSPFRTFTLLLSAPLHSGLWGYCVFVFCSTCGEGMAQAVSGGSTRIPLQRPGVVSSLFSWELRCTWSHLGFGDDLLAPPVGTCGLGVPSLGVPACAHPRPLLSTCTLRRSTSSFLGMQEGLLFLSAT